MTNPRRYLIRMLLFVVVVGAIVAALVVASPIMVEAFAANPGLNGFILGVAGLGVIYSFRQVFVLGREVAWIQSYMTGRPGLSLQATPKLLAPMQRMMGERQEHARLSAMSLRTLLDGVAARLDESRDISRYLIGLLIFLGLLGTFWGLLQTIGSIAQVIGQLSIATGDLAAVFADLKTGLQAPLQGMGTAFSSSLFGLAGSLALGFLDLQSSQAQNRFYNDLEDWLSGQTRLSTGAIGDAGDQAVPAYVQALLEQTADSLENLQRTLDRGEESRINANQGIVTLTDKLESLTDQMRAEQSLMMRLAETQGELKPILTRIAEGTAAGIGGDDGVRTHIRNLDVHLARLLEDLATGRAEMVQELRTEIRVLSRTIAAIAEQSGR